MSEPAAPRHLEPQEVWVDEGPVPSGREIRTSARKAVLRATSSSRAEEAKRSPGLDPAIARDVSRIADPRRADKLTAKLEAARIALERERFSEAKRIARSLVRELSGVVAVHEIIGLASYRLGQWRDATAALEIARGLHERIENLPILADCYRAQRKWLEVDAVWQDLKEESPAPDVMAEGRIVVAGSLADRGDIAAAIDLMRKSATIPRRVREYHLRQWYVLGDLYDRAGDIQRAREFFTRVARYDPSYADVQDRLAEL